MVFEKEGTSRTRGMSANEKDRGGRGLVKNLQKEGMAPGGGMRNL